MVVKPPCKKCGWHGGHFGCSECGSISASSAYMVPGKMELVSDPVAEKLDEMADLSEVWRRSRDKMRPAGSIRAAMLMLADEITILKMGPHS